MQNQSSQPVAPESLTSVSAASQAEARRRLSQTFRTSELVWLFNERYDQHADVWDIEILRQGASGRWMHQRYRFDIQAQVLYFLGESALSDSEFREARQSGVVFPRLSSLS